MVRSATPVSRPNSSSNFVVSFVQGLGDPWRALRFLMGRPSLWPLALLPFILSILLYALAIWAGWHFTKEWLDRVFFEGESWWRDALGVLISILYWIALLIVVTFAFLPVAGFIASPFNDLLSEKTEKLYRRINLDEKFSIFSLLRAIRIGLLGEIARTIKLALLLIFAFFLNFVPVAGPALALALSTYVSIKYLSLEFTSFSMDRRYYTWRQKRDYLERFRARTLGFGTMAFLLMLVPIVNAAFIPVSAVAGTLLFCDTELHK